ncbi:MAG: Na+/H+ antiporter NhaC family protein [Myxococcota bacterium]
MNHAKPNSLVRTCLPLVAFGMAFGLLLGLNVVAPGWGVSTAKAVPASALLALAVTIALSPHQRMQTVQAFIAGMSQNMVLQMGMIFVLAGVFAAFGGAIGSIDAIVAMSLHLLPENWLLPGLFGASCITSLAMGTSMGTLAAVVPIAIGVAASGGASLPVCVATVMGGAMFGDNLSVISDTTIAATRTQGCSMRAKLFVNGPVALLAAAVTVVVLLFLANPHVSSQPSSVQVAWIAAWPYGSVLLLAVCGVPVLWILAAGIGLCLLTGLGQGSLSFMQLPGLVIAGCASMFDVLLATFFVAGLVQVAQARGGLQVILDGLQRHVRSQPAAEASIAALAIVADVCAANNTIAILLCGPLVRRIGEQFQLDRARCASLLDIYACLPQGLLPYGAQMLLVAGLASISPLHVLPYVVYPVVLALLAGIGMAWRMARLNA